MPSVLLAKPRVKMGAFHPPPHAPCPPPTEVELPKDVVLNDEELEGRPALPPPLPLAGRPVCLASALGKGPYWRR